MGLILRSFFRKRSGIAWPVGLSRHLSFGIEFSDELAEASPVVGVPIPSAGEIVDRWRRTETDEAAAAVDAAAVGRLRRRVGLQVLYVSPHAGSHVGE